MSSPAGYFRRQEGYVEMWKEARPDRSMAYVSRKLNFSTDKGLWIMFWYMAYYINLRRVDKTMS